MLAPVTRKIHKTDGILKADEKQWPYIFKCLSPERGSTLTRQRNLWAVHVIINLNFMYQLPEGCGLLNISMIVSLQSDRCAVLIVVVSRSNITQAIARVLIYFHIQFLVSLTEISHHDIHDWCPFLSSSGQRYAISLRITIGNQVCAGLCCSATLSFT